jgi:hypothetical protein
VERLQISATFREFGHRRHDRPAAKIVRLIDVAARSAAPTPFYRWPAGDARLLCGRRGGVVRLFPPSSEVGRASIPLGDRVAPADRTRGRPELSPPPGPGPFRGEHGGDDSSRHGAHVVHAERAMRLGLRSEAEARRSAGSGRQAAEVRSLRSGYGLGCELNCRHGASPVAVGLIRGEDHRSQ